MIALIVGISLCFAACMPQVGKQETPPPVKQQYMPLNRESSLWGPNLCGVKPVVVFYSNVLALTPNRRDTIASLDKQVLLGFISFDIKRGTSHKSFVPFFIYRQTVKLHLSSVVNSC